MFFVLPNDSVFLDLPILRLLPIIIPSVLLEGCYTLVGPLHPANSKEIEEAKEFAARRKTPGLMYAIVIVIFLDLCLWKW